MCEHHGGKAWLVIDSSIRRDAVKEALSGKLWGFQSVPALVLTYAGAKRGKSIEDLARRIGADPSRSVKAGRPTIRPRTAATIRWASRATCCIRSKRRRFYALDISADKRVFPCAALTLGGLRVDEADGSSQNRRRRHHSRPLRRRPRRRRNRVE